MAFNDKWTLRELRDSCRRTLADPEGRFWPDQELNNYIYEWQQYLQDQFEFVWATSTQTTSLSTFTLGTYVPEPMRLEAVYWNGTRLPGLSTQNLDDIKREWRQSTNTATAQVPTVVYQNDSLTFSLWPPPGTQAGTMVLEYPTALSFASSTSTMQIAPWTRYSCKNFVAFKAYLREGPANNPNKALMYKARWDANVKRFRTIWDNYFPGRAPRLKPANGYESGIVLGRAGMEGTRGMNVF